MSLIKVILTGEERIEDNALTIPFSAKVIGTGAQEWINVQNPTDEFVFGAGNGDRVKVPLNLEDYAISASGNQLTLEAPDGNTVVLSVGGLSTLEFADGLASLSLDFGSSGPEMNLGNAVIPDGESLTDPDSVFDTGQELTDTTIDTGTVETPEVFDAGDKAYNFMDDAEVAGSVVINNFSSDDRISITNADVSDYSFANGYTNASDVKITLNYNDTGTMNEIQLTGVVSPDALVYDQTSFASAIGFDVFST
jgi:hypothetical protein